MNFDVIRTFEGGYSTDSHDNLEKKNTFQKGVNGRIYSKNGVFSFKAIKGSRLVYSNSSIVKYLGSFSFSEELIVMAKCDGTLISSETLNTKQVTYSYDENFEISLKGEESNITNETVEGKNVVTSLERSLTIQESETDVNTMYSCNGILDEEIDLSEYYSLNFNVAEVSVCEININEIPENNKTYLDCIYSFKKDNNGNLVGTLLWVGYQNWNINSKIVTRGVEENQFYKRVYYNDGINPDRVINVKDKNISQKRGKDFSRVLDQTLLQPEIESIESGGAIKAMKVCYLYRVISENGQVSDFSPNSEMVDILKEEDAIAYRGGDVSEQTGKLVTVRCNIISPYSNYEIECFAIEYEAQGPPTSIRNLGIKTSASVVEFKHFGTESESNDNVTLADIVSSINTWRYSNALATERNKLIAAGLRNDPVPSAINNLEYLFALHGWDTYGESHDCIMNPEPWNYNMIDVENRDPFAVVSKKVYTTISMYGPGTVTLKNRDNDEFIEYPFLDLPIDAYTDITELIGLLIVDSQDNDVNFPNNFGNLNVSIVDSKILFKRNDLGVITDISDFELTSNNAQFVNNFDSQLDFIDVPFDPETAVYGYKSIGFDQGNGIRISYKEYKEPLLNQATAIYDGSGNVLEYETPSLEKYVQKGEIYRLAFQTYDKSSTKYFSVPIGDVFVPEIGNIKRHINDSGNAVIESERYTNQSEENGIIYGHGIKMKIEVRLDCDLQKKIPMYQILYVERTESNRTILCQGIAAPLMRIQTDFKPGNEMPEAVTNKWNLPYYGGPTYDKRGLLAYDAYGENFQHDGPSGDRRIMTHRGLMYFDSPDIYYNNISAELISSSSIQIRGKLNTDHTPNCVRQRGGGPYGNIYNEVYPKYSRKLTEDFVEGNNHSGELPRYVEEEDDTYSIESHFVNVSVFSKFTHYSRGLSISKATSLERGVVSSGTSLGVTNSLSNNAFVLPNQAWFYGTAQREWDRANNNDPRNNIFHSGITSPGYKTVFIKTELDLFTDDFIGPEEMTVFSEIRDGGFDHVVFDTIPLVNIYRNNREIVYGGRSEKAFSENTYIPLSKTIPTAGFNTAAQVFECGADTYISLVIRTKNDYGDDEITEEEYNNHENAMDTGDITVWKRNGAWAYVAVLETQVEPKMTYEYEFYKENGTHSFEKLRDELINKAYFNKNTLRTFIPRPFKFKDDPDQGNVIAVSDVKVAGELYDSWTIFKVNNFYAELDKDKGTVSNLIKVNDQVFAVQEKQTSLIYIGTDRLISDEQGNPINIKQGSGSVVDGHKTISNYGTAIRRNIVGDDFGFTFFDESKIEFVRVDKALLSKNLLHREYSEKFNNNKITDVEMYYDHINKEINARIRSEKKDTFVLSYNEILGLFNGEREMDSDIFINFDNLVYASVDTPNDDELVVSKDLHLLESNTQLKVLNNILELVLGFYIAANINKVFIYRQWNASSNIDYPFKSVFFKSNLGYERTITESHQWYKIREGIHTVPALNDTIERNASAALRGSWFYVEMTIALEDSEIYNKIEQEIEILAVTNHLRISHQ
jgi:hypothetical protein